jgi:DNA-binding SARP family transcriptional activator
VAARFWPDVLDESARASLRAALTELRGALGPAADSLSTTRETVGLGGGDGAVWVDVRAFDTLLSAGRPADAVEIGAGELLTGIDDEWALEARSEHNRRLGEALEALAAAAESAGDLTAAVRHSRSAAALDPLDEEAGRRLIARLAGAGENASALAAYETLAGRLRSALSVAPSPATRALVEEIRHEAEPSAGTVPLPAMLARRSRHGDGLGDSRRPAEPPELRRCGRPGGPGLMSATVVSGVGCARAVVGGEALGADEDAPWLDARDLEMSGDRPRVIGETTADLVFAVCVDDQQRAQAPPFRSS